MILSKRVVYQKEEPDVMIQKTSYSPVCD